MTMGLVYSDDEELGLIKYRAQYYKPGDDRFFQSEAEIDEFIANLPAIDISQWLGKSAGDSDKQDG